MKTLRKTLALALVLMLAFGMALSVSAAEGESGFGGILDGRYTYVAAAPSTQAGDEIGEVQFDFFADTVNWSYQGKTGSAVLAGDELKFFQGVYLSDRPVTDWFGAGPKNNEGYAGDVAGNLTLGFAAGKLSYLRVEKATTNVIAVLSDKITAPMIEVSGYTRGQPNLLQSSVTLVGSTNGLFLTLQGDMILDNLKIGHDENGVGLKSDKIGGDTFIIDKVTVDGEVQWLNHGAVILPLSDRPGILETNGQDITITGNFVGRVGKDLTFSTGEDKGGNITIGAELSTGVAFVNGVPQYRDTPSTMTFSVGGRLIAGKGDVTIGTNTEGPIVFELVGDIQGNNVTIKPTNDGEICYVGSYIGNIDAAGDVDIEVGTVNADSAARIAIGNITSENGDISIVTGAVNGYVGNISAPNGTVNVDIESAISHGTIEGKTVEKDHIGENTSTSEIVAVPTTSQLLVDNKPVEIAAYNIDDCNYYRLRDMAAVLNGTQKQFSIHWFGEGYITLYTNEPYEAVGGEMEAVANGQQYATPSFWTSVLNGKGISLEVFYIDGDYYFKLRDMASAFNFAVGWQEETNTITIDTTSDFT